MFFLVKALTFPYKGNIMKSATGFGLHLLLEQQYKTILEESA